MDTIKFWDIPNTIKDLVFDGDKTDLRLHSDFMFHWYARQKRKYQSIEKKLDKKEFKGQGWTMYHWYDCSGHNYWIKIMNEGNYIQMTISFDSEDVELSELPKIEQAMQLSHDWMRDIENKYPLPETTQYSR